MIGWLWLDVLALVACSVVAVLDLDAQIGDFKLGRPVFGIFVLAGLLGVYAVVVEQGGLPLPGYGIIAFAVVYLPFLSHAFIDLETTDRLAREHLETLLLSKDLAELRHASGQTVVKEGRRKLRLHWETQVDTERVIVELDVHPSLWPLTISRPHVATIRDQPHLETIRRQILKRRGAGEAA